MPDRVLHVVAFDIPYPPNYGGVIDVYYKLKALHRKGIRIILHAYEYPGRERSDKLHDYCEEVHYYPRLVGFRSALSTKPYIVASRKSDQLLKNLCLIHCNLPFTITLINYSRIVVFAQFVNSLWFNILNVVSLNLSR